MGVLFSACRRPAVDAPVKIAPIAEVELRFEITSEGLDLARTLREYRGPSSVEVNAGEQLLALLSFGPMTKRDVADDLRASLREWDTLTMDEKQASPARGEVALQHMWALGHLEEMLSYLCAHGYLRRWRVALPSARIADRKPARGRNEQPCTICGVYYPVMKSNCGHRCCYACANALATDSNPHCWECRSVLSEFYRVY